MKDAAKAPARGARSVSEIASELRRLESRAFQDGRRSYEETLADVLAGAEPPPHAGEILQRVARLVVRAARAGG